MNKKNFWQDIQNEHTWFCSNFRAWIMEATGSPFYISSLNSWSQQKLFSWDYEVHSIEKNEKKVLCVAVWWDPWFEPNSFEYREVHWQIEWLDQRVQHWLQWDVHNDKNHVPKFDAILFDIDRNYKNEEWRLERVKEREREWDLLTCSSSARTLRSWSSFTLSNFIVILASFSFFDCSAFCASILEKNSSTAASKSGNSMCLLVSNCLQRNGTKRS